MCTTSVRFPSHLLAVCCLILGLGCGSPNRIANHLGPHDFRFPKNALIVHALGGIEGKNYSNSLEALESTLARGGRFLEVDLSFTASGDLVCFHTKHEKHIGLESPITEVSTSEFLSRRYADRFTLIDLETLVRNLRDRPDTYLITDCKHDFKLCMEKVLSVVEAVDPSMVGRIIPQFFTTDQWRDVVRMEAEHGSFATVIFTLYRTKTDDDTVVELAGRHQIPVVTMSRKRFNTDLVMRLAAIGVDSLVHTVNKPPAMIGYVNRGVRGLYSDLFVQWNEVVAAAPRVTDPPKGRPQGAAADPPPG
jgi:glycerophosphoryl diester phosphodiesterase